MVAIFEYKGGLRFTGWIAESEEKAWQFLDEKYGWRYENENFGCNHDAFCLKKVEMVGNGTY